MSWTAPRTWVTGETLTSTLLNTHLRDNLLALSGVGTTLPASPADNDRFMFVDSTTNPSYAWVFRYNGSSTSTYKWEFIGGTPQNISDITLRTMVAAGVFTDIPGTTASLTVARAGEYDFTVIATTGNTGATPSEIDVGLSIGGVDPAVNDVTVNYTAANGGQITSSNTYFATAIAAAGLVKPRYKSQLAAQTKIIKIAIIPRRAI